MTIASSYPLPRHIADETVTFPNGCNTVKRGKDPWSVESSSYGQETSLPREPNLNGRRHEEYCKVCASLSRVASPAVRSRPNGTEDASRLNSLLSAAQISRGEHCTWVHPTCPLILSAQRLNLPYPGTPEHPPPSLSDDAGMAPQGRPLKFSCISSSGTCAAQTSLHRTGFQPSDICLPGARGRHGLRLSHRALTRQST